MRDNNFVRQVASGMHLLFGSGLQYILNMPRYFPIIPLMCNSDKCHCALPCTLCSKQNCCVSAPPPPWVRVAWMDISCTTALHSDKNLSLTDEADATIVSPLPLQGACRLRDHGWRHCHLLG